MKNSNFFIILFMAVGIIGFLPSCGNKPEPTPVVQGEATMPDDSSQPATIETVGAEYTAKYVCPMHCEGSGSEVAGKCPVCNMDYVLNSEHRADGHVHGEDD